MLQSKFSPGDTAPELRLADGSGQSHVLPAAGAAATVLVFFRGNW